MTVHKLLNERQLLQKIANGDQMAFTVLFKHYHGYVFAFGRKLTYSEGLAEDIVQDIFLKLWIKRERLAQLDNFPAYLVRTVQNHSFNILRQLAQQKRVVTRLNYQPSEADYDTAKVVGYNETAHLLKEALTTLSPQQKMAYHLCHQKGLKYSEAAEKMNISPQTVHEYMKLALAKIRQHFKHNGASYLFMASLFTIKS